MLEQASSIYRSGRLTVEVSWHGESAVSIVFKGTYVGREPPEGLIDFVTTHTQHDGAPAAIVQVDMADLLTVNSTMIGCLAQLIMALRRNHARFIYHFRKRIPFQRQFVEIFDLPDATPGLARVESHETTRPEPFLND